MNTTAHQAAMHSSNHREDEVSEGARRNVRLANQTTLKFNAAASDERGQMSSEKSESENSDPTGDRARTKLKKKSKLACRDCGARYMVLHCTLSHGTRSALHMHIYQRFILEAQFVCAA